MFLSRVDRPQLQSSGIAVKRYCRKSKAKDELRERKREGGRTRGGENIKGEEKGKEEK